MVFTVADRPVGFLPNQIVNGSIVPAMGFQTKDEIIQATVKLKALDGNKFLTKKLSVKIATTDGVSGTYWTLDAFDSGDPIPANLAQDIYTAFSQLQYDGRHVLVEQECLGRVKVGNTLSLTGGLQAWQTMQATVQSVTEDLEDGRSTIVFGHAEHLGVEDLVELLRVSRSRIILSSVSERSQGSTSASGVELGKNLPKENTTGGAEQYQTQTYQKFDDPAHKTVVDGGTVVASFSHQVGAAVNGGALITAEACAGKDIRLRWLTVYDENCVPYRQLFFCSEREPLS